MATRTRARYVPAATMLSPRQSSVLLPSERTLAIAEFGPPEGFPVLYFHGFGGSRLEPLLGMPEGGVPGVRLIAVDRPGIGGSTPHPELELADWTDEVEALVDELGLRRYSLLGYSWGGAYALSAARRPQSRLFRVGLVSAFSHWAMGAGASNHLSGRMRTLAFFARRTPGLMKWALRRQLSALRKSPESAVDKLLRSMPPNERTVLEPRREALVASAREASRQDEAGLFDDSWRVLRPWNFSVEFIQADVRVFHGTADEEVRFAMSKDLQRVMPNVTLTRWEGEGHSALWTHLPEVLTSLCPADVLRRAA